MRDYLVSRDDIRKLHPIFQGKHGDKLIDFAFRISALEVANNIYNNSKHLTGHEFCTDVLDKLGVKRTLHNYEVLNDFEGKPFITVSNHVYGHIDGIAIIEAIASKFKDYKVMVNFILGLIDTMSENFITVKPMKDGKREDITLSGIRECFTQLKDGHPLGFFPAGAISNLYFKKGRFVIEDREWQPSVIRIIMKANVPVIPVHISGRNSLSFYLSRIFGWKARNLRLCHELKNKNGLNVDLTFGDPIMPNEIKSFKRDVKNLGKFIREKTYYLADTK